MSSQEGESDPLQGRSDVQPTNEFITLAGLAAATMASATLGNKAIEWLVPKDPFLVLIEDSYVSKTGYILILEVRNLDVHSVYVEKVNVEKPLKLILIDVIKENVGLDLHGDTATIAPPYRIGSRKFKRIQLLLDPPPPEMTCGEIQMEISRLGQDASEMRKIRFLIRGASGTAQIW
jgi:hypothetical protein